MIKKSISNNIDLKAFNINISEIKLEIELFSTD